jgi:DNA-3-methyladenine glycosylase II
MTPRYWKKACLALSTADPVMARLIAEYGDTGLSSRGDPFNTLARSIVGQQISIKAADAVWARLEAELGSVTPEAAATAGAERLRGCGLSARKAGYVADLAGHFLSGALHPGLWQEEDATVIAELTRVKGIGRWTAEMFLIFHLLRPDVFPLTDLGLQRAIQLHYGRGRPLSLGRMEQVGAAWRPWRTVAVWYLWRSLDPIPVEY